MAVIPNWLRPASFLDAAQSGARIGLEIARLQGRNQGYDRRPRIGGGGGGDTIRLPRPIVEEAVEPTGPYIGGIPGSPVLIDKERTGQPEAPRLPFTLAGKQFVTNKSGNVVDYVAPPNLSTPFGSATEGRFQLDPKTGKPVQITPPAARASDEPRLSTVDTANMTDAEKQMAAMFNPSRISGPASVVQKYLSAPKTFSSEQEARQSGIKSGDNAYIKGVGLVELQ